MNFVRKLTHRKHAIKISESNLILVAPSHLAKLPYVLTKQRQDRPIPPTLRAYNLSSAYPNVTKLAGNEN